MTPEAEKAIEEAAMEITGSDDPGPGIQNGFTDAVSIIRRHLVGHDLREEPEFRTHEFWQGRSKKGLCRVLILDVPCGVRKEVHP